MRALILSDIQRVKHCVTIHTVTANWQTRQNVAALLAGQWPHLDEIIKAVPEMVQLPIRFEACPDLERSRKWDVEDEMSRFRLEHGVLE